MVRSIRSSTSDSNLARVILMRQVLGTGGVGRDVGQVDVGLLALEDSSILAFSAASFRRCRASTSFFRSTPLLFLELGDDVVDDALVEVFAAQEGVAVGRQHFELVSPSMSAISMMEMSKVPPPRSNTAILRSPFFLSRPKARAAAVGSLMMRLTSRPAMRPASLVAWRWASLK